MQHQFHVAQQQLAYERNEMHNMEEHDRVKASEQKTKMQRMAAHRQAEEYERHLKALTDSVFPTEVPILEPPSSTHSTYLMFCPNRKTSAVSVPDPRVHDVCLCYHPPVKYCIGIRGPRYRRACIHDVIERHIDAALSPPGTPQLNLQTFLCRESTTSSASSMTLTQSGTH
jgi:hypothetical protein